MMQYEDFLASKRVFAAPSGFEPAEDLLSEQLFPFQADCVRWACRRGRAALFEDCGLGKTPQQLSWAEQVVAETAGAVLILAPMGVAWQTVQESEKFGISAKLVASQEDVSGPGIYVSNYEKLHRFELEKFQGLVLDESSILKAYDGVTRKAIISKSKAVPYRLACTATAAPNDFMELGNHAEFLGVMSFTEMLATFFVHDGGDTSKWRLKGHAEDEFWKWVCSWAIHLRRPSDLGYEDGRFVLPELKLVEHVTRGGEPLEGVLFAMAARTLQERRQARRGSIDARTKLAADLAMSNGEQWVLWCGLNDEADELTRLTGAEEIRGATGELERERIARGFLDGSIRVVVTKPSIWGFGMNLQCCHNTALVGLSDSYEEFYQVVRRFWRFGQKRSVNAHIITSELEGAVLENIKRKETDARRMSDAMVAHMANICSAAVKGTQRESVAYNPAMAMTVPSWLN